MSNRRSKKAKIIYQRHLRKFMEKLTLAWAFKRRWSFNKYGHCWRYHNSSSKDLSLFNIKRKIIWVTITLTITFQINIWNAVEGLDFSLCSFKEYKSIYWVRVTEDKFFLSFTFYLLKKNLPYKVYVKHMLSIRDIIECAVLCCAVLRLIWLFVTPWAVAHQAPLSMGFSRKEYWSGLPFPSLGDLPDPGMEPAFLVTLGLAGGFFTTATPPIILWYRKPYHSYSQRKI